MELATRGVTLELAEEVAERLRGDFRQSVPDIWHDVIPLQPMVEEPEPPAASVCDDDDDDDDELSLTPPPSLPVVLVNIQRLIGYLPDTDEERAQIQRQISSALCADGDEPTTDIEATLGVDFLERVDDLLESGTARHAETTTVLPNTREWIAIDYPDYLCTLQPRTVHVTAHVWKRLVQPHAIGVVDRLLTHLRNCHCSLLWKAAMRDELEQLAEDQEACRRKDAYQRELEEWRQRRTESLEKLYSVRETFVHRLEVAAEERQRLEAVREQKVADRLRQERAGLEAFDMGSAFFSFPTEATEDLLGLPDPIDEEEEYPLVSDEDDSDAGYEIDPDHDSFSDSSGDEETATTAAETLATDLSLSMDGSLAERRLDRRRQAAARRRQQRLQQIAADKEAAEQAKLEAARAEEARVREACTTIELKKAIAVEESIQDRLTHVDELLESLQEEEWADEEEEEEEEEEQGLAQFIEEADEVSVNDMTLLDQILAMILGATPPPLDTEEADHVAWLREEHRSIVLAWKDYFGRLPPPLQQLSVARNSKIALRPTPTPEPTPLAAEDRQALRESLGIEAQAGENWDNDDDDDEPPRPVVRGLRPGGRAER